MDDLFTCTAAERVRAIRTRKLGVEELVREYLRRIDTYDGPDGLNAIAELDGDALRTARALDADGVDRSAALFGLPVLIKDNIDVAGLHTTAGSLALQDNLAVRDAHVVANLRRNGAVILGKAHMTEFAHYTDDSMPGGYSSQGGQVRHAYDRDKNPSGSSSGSAIAMSAGLCAAAVGTDTSFSIVGCVTENGVTGLKPAYGSLSAQGIVPIARTLDSAGPITRDLADALLVYGGMRDQPPAPVEPMPPRTIRLAVNTCNRDQVSERQLAMYEAVLTALREDGTEITEVEHPYAPAQRNIMRCEFRNGLEDYLLHSGARFRTLAEIVGFYESDPDRMMKYGISLLRGALDTASGKLDDPAYMDALAERKQLRRQIMENLRGFDACLMTGPTNIMHFTGLPSLALRLGMADDGTPRGMILYGADEQRLFAAALTIERYCRPVTPPIL
ncbi:MAG: hypothetical protein KBA30_08960 [Clostridia bacterium]|nr:hypothetical protein [Clostridia bacterium]